MAEMLRFDGQVAVVTGAGGEHNLGRAHAKLLAARGAKVVVNDVRAEGAQQVADEIVAEGGTAIANSTSVGDAQGAREIVGAAVDAWGRVDILINNAGAMIFAEFDEMTDDDVRSVIEIHLLGSMWMSRAVWPHFKAQGSGRIVNTESMSYQGGLQLSAYGTAKSGVMGLTFAAASVGEPFGIAVNSIFPMAGTDAVALMLDSPRKDMIMHAVPELVSPAVAYLAHPDCPVTGETLFAGGGRVSLRDQAKPRVADGSDVLAMLANAYANPELTIEDVRDHWDEILGADWSPVDFGGPERLEPSQRPYVAQPGG